MHSGADAQPSLAGLFRALWHYAEGARLKNVTSSAMLVGADVIKLSVPWLAAQAINAIQTSGMAATGQPGSLRTATFLMMAILLVSAVA